MGITLSLLLGYYPQTNRQVQRLNQGTETFLQSNCAKNQIDWSQFLLLAEYVQNSLFYSSLLLIPFQHSRLPILTLLMGDGALRCTSGGNCPAVLCCMIAKGCCRLSSPLYPPPIQRAGVVQKVDSTVYWTIKYPVLCKLHDLSAEAAGNYQIIDIT